jgi:hypothetical protein
LLLFIQELKTKPFEEAYQQVWDEAQRRNSWVSLKIYIFEV